MGGIYWLFNRFWWAINSCHLSEAVRAAEENGVDLDIWALVLIMMGTKAYPVNMICFHHQIRMTSLDSQFGLLIAAYVAAAAYMT